MPLKTPGHRLFHAKLMFEVIERRWPRVRPVLEETNQITVFGPLTGAVVCRTCRPYRGWRETISNEWENVVGAYEPRLISARLSSPRTKKERAHDNSPKWPNSANHRCRDELWPENCLNLRCHSSQLILGKHSSPSEDCSDRLDVGVKCIVKPNLTRLHFAKCQFDVLAGQI